MGRRTILRPFRIMAKILILEDDPERIKIFQRNLISHSVTMVVTASEAIQKLGDETWELLMLDHDLGGKVLVASGPETDYEVAKWLYENPDRQPPNIILHSFNTVGRANMKALLPQAHDFPGAWVNIGEMLR